MGLCNGGVSQTEHCSSGNGEFFGMFVLTLFHPGGETSDIVCVLVSAVETLTVSHILSPSMLAVNK